jgi:hypothetical protein
VIPALSPVLKVMVEMVETSYFLEGVFRHLPVDAAVHDAINQRFYVQHVLIEQKGVRPYPVQLRYVWPSELDLMARLAGSKLRNRHGGWKNETFSSELPGMCRCTDGPPRRCLKVNCFEKADLLWWKQECKRRPTGRSQLSGGKLDGGHRLCVWSFACRVRPVD